LSGARCSQSLETLAQTEVEYAKYRQKTITVLTSVEQDYLATLKDAQKSWKTSKEILP
jgi:hypothetical protein